MEFSEAKPGRIFVIRLHDGEILHDEIEGFAKQHSILEAGLIAVGGADEASRLVVGPRAGRSEPVTPIECVLEGVHEIAGIGTIFPNEKGEPILHMHVAAGRERSTITGCVRRGVRIWHVLEIVLFELVGARSTRVLDTKTGFELLRANYGKETLSD